MPTRDSQTEGLSHFAQQEMIALSAMAAPNTLDSCRLQNYPQATQEKHL